MKPGNETSPVLVTGAAGFIGHCLIRHLEDENRPVAAMVRPGSKLNDARPDTSLISCDLARDAIPELPAGIDTIFHLAGKAHALAEVSQDNAEYARINTGATRRLLEAARRAGVRSFVFFSSVKAVGDAPADRQPVDESWDAEADTPYGRSKRAAEELVLRGGYVPHPVVIRPCLVHGKGAKGNLEKMVDAVRAGRFPSIPEVGNRRSMVHVDDLVRAALMVADAPQAAGKTYIVADNEPFSTRQLYEWICSAIERRPSRRRFPLWTLRALARVGDGVGRLRGRRFVFDSDALAKITGNAWYSSALIQREIGWRPQRSVKNSLSDLVERRWTATSVEGPVALR